MPHANIVAKSAAVSIYNIFIYAALCGIYTQTPTMMHARFFTERFKKGVYGILIV
jgi:hypothetical protein